MNTPSTPPNPLAHFTNPPLAYLPALVDTLSQQPELDILQAAVRRFVAQRQDWYLSRGLRPRDRPSFAVTTLLQALAWERLDRIDTRPFTSGDFRVLFTELLDSPAAKALGRELHEALGWDNEVDAQHADAQLLRQLVWCALILEIERPALRRPGFIAGYDLAAKRTVGRSCEWLRADVVSFLGWQVRGVDGLRSGDMANLALCALEPLNPVFARNDIPPDLLCGTLRWANFAHGVALAEALCPGASRQLGFEQLVELPLEQSSGADEGCLQVIAATRVLPALQWAIAHDAVAHRPDGLYRGEDIDKALGALDEYSARLAGATLALLRDPPDRIRMAEQKFTELLGDQGYLRNTIMRPSTTWGRIESSLRNPAPGVRAGEFYLLDVFAAGFMKNGMDRYEPHLQHHEQALLDAITPALDKLKGVDIPALYDAEFDAWFEQVQAGYRFVIEALFEQLAFEDRTRLGEGAVTVLLLRGETGKTLLSETAQDRADQQGRFGFMLRCEHGGRVFFYEMFPFRAQIRRRLDLNVGQRVKPADRHIDWAPTLIETDWATYRENRAPRDGIRSAVIPVQIEHFPPVSEAIDSHSLASMRPGQIADAVARWNMPYDRQRTYMAQRGVTGVEWVTENYPPVLRLVEILVPGLGCYNAVRTGQAPVLACALDVGSIMALPAFALARGLFRLTLRSGRIGLQQSLPAFKAVAGRFIKTSGAMLNPVELGRSLGAAIYGAGKSSQAMLRRMTGRMNSWASLGSGATAFRMPQRVNGRIGYPLSGRGAAKTSVGADDPGRRIRNVRDYDAFLETHDIFQGNARLRAEVLVEIEAGADVRVHVRRDGARTLVKKDTADDIFIDLADNSTVRLERHYDYRVLKSWAVENEAAQKGMKRLAVDRIRPSRPVIDPHRLRSVKDAIENGHYLPPMDIRQVEDGYEVINGNHRLQAAVDLRLEHVPVVIHGSTGATVQPSGATPQV